MTIVDEPTSELLSSPSFRDLELIAPLHEALEKAGYEIPTPIQAATIPHLLAGRDVLGQAQTGTGKTAAFALPLLSRIDLDQNKTQVLVLAPTRELAIQVADSFKRYAKCMKGLRVAPIYGGQAYSTQIHQLERGLHVVVGTPGRVMDHMRQGTLKIDALQCLVLDEADEMLRMGFVDDVQWILSHTPEQRQIALFSATMPPPIRKIADEHLKNPEVVAIDAQQRTAETIRQRFVILPHRAKFDSLTKILESETVDGVLVFAKTKVGTVELAEGLVEAGFSAVALNGDIAQAQRERTVDQLKSGAINIVVATDVAARGLDVQRISHVINYDLPFDTEAYVHRIGRTGRAGRSGEAILFVAPSQRGFLRVIERGTSQTLEPMTIPDAKTITKIRIQRFKDAISETIQNKPSSFYLDLVTEYQQATDAQPLEIAAALASMLHGDRSLIMQETTDSRREDRFERGERGDRQREERSVFRRESRHEADSRDRPARTTRRQSGEYETFRLEVGAAHGVKAGNIVGAIANEAGLASQEIRGIKIQDDFSTVELPAGMPRDVFKTLGRAWVVGRQLRISKLSDHPSQRDFGSKDTRKPKRAREVPVATTEVASPKVKKPRKPKKPKVVDPELQQIVDEATQLIENV
jgi:ATP-dependent RNA helicase DeaD